jgi:DNA-binding XRE family transcriptional regulator
MTPKCSFTLTAKIPKKSIPKIKPKTLGEFIKKVRQQKNLSQAVAAKSFGVNGMCLSSWELNKKTIHPKYLESILDFLGFTPRLKSDFDKIGIRTKLWRKQHSVSMDTFLQMVNLPKEEILKIEQARYCKLDKKTETKINTFLKNNATSFATHP